jgi:hypothetical protein
MYRNNRMKIVVGIPIQTEWVFEREATFVEEVSHGDAIDSLPECRRSTYTW